MLLPVGVLQDDADEPAEEHQTLGSYRVPVQRSFLKARWRHCICKMFYVHHVEFDSLMTPGRFAKTQDESKRGEKTRPCYVLRALPRMQDLRQDFRENVVCLENRLPGKTAASWPPPVHPVQRRQSNIASLTSNCHQPEIWDNYIWNAFGFSITWWKENWYLSWEILSC